MSGSSGGRITPRYRGAVESYLKAIRRYNLLTKSGEHRLATAGRSGTESAVNALVEANLRLVVKIAKEYRNSYVGFDDLIAEGNLGLIEAARRFDPDRGVRFVSYATWWIRKHMLRAMDRQAHQSSTPRPEGGESGTHAAAGRRSTRQRILSFDEFMNDSSDRHVIESIVGESEKNPEGSILERQLAEALRSVLHRLPAKERDILARHFGLDGSPPLTLADIGDAIGLTRERVRQLELRALDRARRLLAGSRGR